MKLEFSKYQGAGNDFVMVDDRWGIFPREDTSLVERLCDRRYGIGADGLILLQKDSEADFAMVYYNTDGRESTMCGNGGRCIAAFARDLGIGNGQTVEFRAADGMHKAVFKGKAVQLGMNDVTAVTAMEGGMSYDGIVPLWNCFLDTGSPHYVSMIKEGLESLDVARFGRAIRNNDHFAPRGGTNVNFVQKENGKLLLRTYERGVEDETLACGTGTVAAAVAAHRMGIVSGEKVYLKAPGGDLEVDFRPEGSGCYTNIRLTGPAEKVFEGIFYSEKER